MRAVVFTVDQRRSRDGTDAVPAMLRSLAGLPVALDFQRTAGDEFQGLLDSPTAVVDAIELLTRDGRWHVGIGLGEVETPLPPQSREGRGPAYVHAREAVSTARTSPWHLRVVGETDLARHLESVLWLWSATLSRRSEKGWEVADLVAQGLSYDATADRLGISQSAVSQRAAAAGLVEGQRARELAVALLGCHLDATSKGNRADS